ncbi:MAG: NTP transferase domain-containing protein [Lachnospiraceae bacterium]|nr:NTP transferase domain-containing protein [Lachnospiraceae bacterium]
MGYNKGRFQMMQAIILCGGQGTRLRSVIGETQKTMTMIGNTPFLVNIVNYLKSYKITNVIFSTGYKSEEVEAFFGKKCFFGVDISYAKETMPLGTAGAIRNALPQVKYDSVYVLNGDTLFKANLKDLKENFDNLDADMSIVCKESDNRDRFGTITLMKSTEKKDDRIVLSFDEKVKVDKNKKVDNDLYINGGIYLLKKDLIKQIPEGVKVSLEKEMIPKWIDEGKVIGGVVSDADFVDIGTPESLEKYKNQENQ